MKGGLKHTTISLKMVGLCCKVEFDFFIIAAVSIGLDLHTTWGGSHFQQSNKAVKEKE